MTQQHNSPISPNKPKNSRRRIRRLALAITLISLGVVVAGGLFAVSVTAARLDQGVNQNVRRSQELPPDSPSERGAQPRPKRPPSSKAVNYLLLGVDAPSGGAAGSQRSDVMMVLHLDGDRRSASLISFPRDLYVAIPGRGKDKINAAYAYGGTQLAVRTVEGLLHSRIDHIALIDFEGFVRLTDDLGGVTVYNEYPSASRGFTFPRGNITISGDQALAYVRERKDLPHGDLDRAGRQRAVMQAIFAKGLGKDMLTDPDRFITFAGNLARHVDIDNSLTQQELRKTVLSLRMSPNDVHEFQAPISGFGTSPTKQSIDLVDQQGMAALATALRADDLADYRAKAKHANG